MQPAVDLALIEAVANDLRDLMGDDFDPQTFMDTLDGETDFIDLLRHLTVERQEALCGVKASKDLCDTYTARKSRLEVKAKGLSQAIGKIMDASGETKISLDIATLTRTKGRPAVKIYDEAAIPTQLTVTTTRPDKEAIKKQLEAGEAIPGAELETGPRSLTVRIK